MNSSPGLGEIPSMKGKVCIVTGGTSGIGREISLGLCRLGASVTIVGRSREKCKKTVEEIQSLTSSKCIEMEVCDLTSMDSVVKLAETISMGDGRLDVLVNNAGGVFSSHSLTEDGFERTAALNYLSPVLLTRLLVPAMKLSGRSRIINIGSGAHTGGRIEFDFKYHWKYSPMKAYSTSKLMFTMFTYALSRRLNGTGISTSVVQPGFVATNLGRNSGSGLLSASFSIMRPFQISAVEAAKTPLWLASSAALSEIDGKCFSRMKEVHTAESTYDVDMQDDLWLLTSKALGLPAELELQ